MSQPGITILGLGPGDPKHLTRQAWETLENASEIYLRTRQHPTVEGFSAGLKVHSFDHLYEENPSYEEVYAAIVDQVLALGARLEGVIYGVPGHPFVAEATCPEIVRRARLEGVPVRVVEGISFLEPILTALELDPMPRITLIDALELASGHHPPFPPDMPALIAQIYSAQIAADIKLTLMAVYPDEHPVRLVHGAGTKFEQVESLPLFAIDRSQSIGLLTTLYLPPLGPATSFEAFQEVIAHLRAPDGCPWDREQTHQTLRPHLLEEAYELLSAIDADDSQAMAEEFGDLLLQIVLHAQIAIEYGEFTMADILRGIHTKIVRRHPHVFGDLEVGDMDTVLLNWERLKAAEREENGLKEKGLLDGVASSFPALIQSQEYQDRAARVGFDWSDISGVLDKISEEVNELRAAVDPESRAAEMGDLLFALVNLARWYKIDAESALREANERFRRRFRHIEDTAKAQGRELSDMTLDEMDVLWDDAKLDASNR
jgi:tetrapyrrole methylase family protein/MazG family protein